MPFNTSTTGLTLNILEIIPSKENISIYYIDYQDDILKKLRKDFSDYSFYRDGNKIYSWNLFNNPKNNLPESFTQITITRNDNTLVFNKILESAIVQWFRNNGSKIYKLRHSSVWEVEFKTNIKDFKGLKAIPVLNFSIHPFYSKQSDKLITALSLRYATKTSFNEDESTFSKQNFDTRNLSRYTDGKLIANISSTTKFLNATGQSYEFNNHRNSLNKEDNLYLELDRFITIFNTKIKDNVFLPDGLKITEFNFHNIPNSHFNADIANKPSYYYYQERQGTKLYNTLTQELKPYTYDAYVNRIVKILVITPDAHEGSTEIFIKKLEQKLKTIFHISNIELKYLVFNSKTESYENALGNYDCSGFDIAIVTVSTLDKSIEIKKSPYYITKAKLLNERIPTQEVTVELMRKDDNLIYDAIALNVYSKIGGMAWVVNKVDKAKLEVVIGISSSINYKSERIIGFANIFDFNGKYLIGDCSTLSTFDNYALNLETYLTESIKNLINSRNIEKGGAFRLIFHLSKEAGKDYEIKAIENTLSKFKEYDIQFGIVHLSYNHNLRLFQDQGRDFPKRGTFVQLSTFQALLHLGKGTKVPILVRLDQRSTYKDLFDASKQVIYFCHLCYRNFRPANVPVTIKYPGLMAKLTDELSQVPNWDPNQLNKIKDKLWFI